MLQMMYQIFGESSEFSRLNITIEQVNNRTETQNIERKKQHGMGWKPYHT